MLKTKMSKKTMTQTCKEQKDDRKHRSKMLTKKKRIKTGKSQGLKKRAKLMIKKRAKLMTKVTMTINRI